MTRDEEGAEIAKTETPRLIPAIGGLAKEEGRDRAIRDHWRECGYTIDVQVVCGDADLWGCRSDLVAGLPRATDARSAIERARVPIHLGRR